jgi:transposase
MSQDILASVRPVLFDTSYEEFPYSFGGTLFIISFRGRCYALTCRHVTGDNGAESIIVVKTVMPKLGDSPVRVQMMARIDAAENDLGDVVALGFSDEINSASFHEMVYSATQDTIGASWVGDRLRVIGCLNTRSSVDTESKHISDEARVGQKGSIETVWAPIGSRPPMVRDNRHDSVHIFGAICPARGIGAAIIMPGVNTEAMNEHLKEISCQVATSAHALLVCNGAGWHQPGERLIVPDNITLLRLPPYAPELNPMENVWDYLRGNKLSSLVCDTYEGMRNASKEAWNFIANDPARIVSIGTRDWACVNL